MEAFFGAVWAEEALGGMERGDRKKWSEEETLDTLVCSEASEGIL